MKAAELDTWSADTGFDLVGEPEPRVDASAKVQGRAVYTSDAAVAGLLVGAFVRSPHPHARVVSIDTTAAERVDGVVGVITQQTLAGGGPFADLRWYGEDVPFFSDVARHVGDEIALVVAESADAARDGVAAIDVEWDVFDHVTDLEHALDTDVRPIHGDSNLVDHADVTQRGDPDRMWESSAFVVEGTFRTPTAIHHALEPHGAVAEWIDDTLTLHTSTQAVNDVRSGVANRLRLSHNQVRVVAEHIGGGFGAKQVPWRPTVAAAVASKLTGRPVRVMNDRWGESVAAGKRNATVQRVRLAADGDGRLTAIAADIVADVGAYSVAGEASAVPGVYLHLYACDNVRTTYRRVYTNTGPAVAFRAPGYVEGTFALESAIDELARRVGIEPLELRRRNYVDHDQQQGLPWSSPEALRRAYDLLDAEAAERSLRSPATDRIVHGRGFAANDWLAATAQPPGFAWGEFNLDGSVHIATSTQDIGTGTRTALRAIAAEELGIDPARVRISMGDTAVGPPAPPSAGSTTMPTMAPAVRAAATALRERILARAAQHLQTPAADLTIVGDRIVRRDDASEERPDTRSIGVGDLLEAIQPDGIHAEGARLEVASDVSPRTHSAAMADVTVDLDTGRVVVDRIVVAPDCGRIIDPLLVESQVIGGATQGIGFALMEEQIVDHRLGVVVNANLEEYLVPTIGDTCEIVHAAIDMPDLAANPLGIKGIGELPLIPVPAAIANAVRDATGVRFHELPLTRRRILDTLGGAT